MNINELWGEAKGYKSQLDSGALTPAEFKDLISSLGIASKIKENADEFDKNIQIRGYLMDLLNFAETISIL